MKPLISIVGPTGVGKSRIAVELALRLNAEIINADSRQVYRHMDIGTAKPAERDLAMVPHHLYSIIDPDQDFSLAQYQQLALGIIEDILARRRIPLLVGGSGQYVRAIIEGWNIPRVPPDPELRLTLEREVRENGADKLFERLEKLDPEAAAKIDKRNIRRVIRGLEVSMKSKNTFSALKTKQEPAYNIVTIGLTAKREELYRMIDRRVDEMLAAGFESEVESLIKKGYDLNLSSMNSIGYQQIGKFLSGQLTRDEAIQRFKFDNHRFVRHQYAWFSLKDPKIHWFNVENISHFELTTKILALITHLLEP